MAPASVQIVCMEPVVFLRGQSAVGEDARGRRRPVNFDAPPSQLRGLLILTLPKASRIKEISITLHGKARTDWPEGIGPNRLDTVEESTIFKQKIVLYDAKDVPQADVRGRPRSSSVGPGTSGLQDDLDMLSMSRELSHSGFAPLASSSNRSAKQAMPRTSGDKGTSEERKNNKNFTKAIGKTAAKAGSAILPPTLMREIQASRQAGQTYPPQMSFPQSPEISPLHSPASSRMPSWNIQRGVQGTSQGYFDSPPVYKSEAANGHGLARSASTSEQVLSGEAPMAQPLQSGISSHPGQEQMAEESSSQRAAPAPHPQSINAAGPSHKSILHPERRTREGQQSKTRETPSGSPVNVRFNPEAVAVQTQSNPPSRNSPSSSSLPSTPNGGVQQQQQSSEQFAIASTNSSPGISRASLSNGFSAAAKGKTRVLPTSTPGATSQKRGIKSMLGTLLKEDEDRQRHESRSSHHEDEESQIDWREFKKGTYTYPFSIPLPSNLPPTLHADFGSNAYAIKAYVHRAGPLTSNLSAEKEVVLVHAPDEDGQDDMESIIVERNWEDSLRYIIMVMGKSFPVGGRIPVWAKFVPTDKVRIHRIIASLEERTAYFAKSRRVARHEVPRRWTLLKMLPNNSVDGILPVVSESADALESSPVAKFARQAQELYSGADEEAVSQGIAALMDPTGPWELSMDLEIPKALKTRINISSNHNKSNIAVHHIVKIAIRVERIQESNKASNNQRHGKAPENQRKLYDILIDAPIAINHSQTANIWLSLPDYWSVAQNDETSVRARESGVETRNGNSASASVLPHSPTSSRGGQVGRSSSFRSGNAADEEVASAARNAQLVNLGRTWLSLSGAGAREGEIGLPDSSTSANALPPFAPSSNATVTYSESTVHGGLEDAGLPTYEMIDRERGSIDLPPSRRVPSNK